MKKLFDLLFICEFVAKYLFFIFIKLMCQSGTNLTYSYFKRV